MQLGQFELLEVVGRGGMAEVWRARHVAEQVDVAVKIVTGKQARDEAFREAFRREAQAVARLSHPGITHVFDYGTVSPLAAEGSDGALLADSPWMAMQLADRGSLSQRVPVRDWPALRSVLLQVLDALAHAHARQIIHRDLKPPNVLFTAAPGEGGDRLLLTDFGIAHALDHLDWDAHYSTMNLGTPSFMSPEQIRGRWRDYGPWTDLYALGCLAFVLCTGRPPFRGRNFIEIASGHMGLDPPQLKTHFERPEGIEGWIHHLLAKAPRDRPRCAADAARALAMLGATQDIPTSSMPAVPYPSADTGLADALIAAPTEMDLPDLQHSFEQRVEQRVEQPFAQHSTGNQPSPTDAHSPATEAPLPPMATVSLSPGELHPLVSRPASAAPSGPVSRPSVPRHWAPAAAATTTSLKGVGLGLFGLRAPPFVNRDEARDGIRAALHRAVEMSRPHAVTIRGPAGFGKTRLATWMSERAHEVGAAVVLRTRHNPIPGPIEGLEGVVENVLHCFGLDGPAKTMRLEEVLASPLEAGHIGRADLTVLASMVGRDAASGTAVEPATVEQRAQAVARLIRWHGDHSGVVLLADDAHWGGETLGFVERALNGTVDALKVPLLFLLTVRDDALTDRPIEREALERIEALPTCSQLYLQPLSADDHRNLVQSLLGFEPTAAERIATQTAGNPVHAVQLVGDLVARGALEHSAAGLRITVAQETVVVDVGVEALWERAIARLLARYDNAAEVRVVLEVAAALGVFVDTREWAEACEKFHIAVPEGLLNDLVERGWAVPRDESWVFSHGSLREALLSSCASSGRAQPVHYACAEMLASRPEALERFALHLLAAERPGEALEPLMSSARKRVYMGDLKEAAAHLDRFEQALEASDAPASDPRQGEILARRASLHIWMGEFADGQRQAERAIAHARRYGHVRVEGIASMRAAECAVYMGRSRDADALFATAQQKLRQVGDLFELSRVYIGWGSAARTRGDAAQAAEHLTKALALLRGTDDVRGLVGCLITFATTLGTLQRYDDAMELIVEARDLARANGFRSDAALAASNMAATLRVKGDLFASKNASLEALPELEAVDPSNAFLPRINLAMICLLESRYTDARRWLTDTNFQPQDVAVTVGTHTILLVCDAAEQNWARCWERIDQIRPHLDDVTDADIGECAELAARLCADVGQTELAEHCTSLAASAWRRLRREPA